MRRAAERAAMREELSRLWEGLLDAQQGDCLVRSRPWRHNTHGSSSNSGSSSSGLTALPCLSTEQAATETLLAEAW